MHKRKKTNNTKLDVLPLESLVIIKEYLGVQPSLRLTNKKFNDAYEITLQNFSPKKISIDSFTSESFTGQKNNKFFRCGLNNNELLGLDVNNTQIITELKIPDKKIKKFIIANDAYNIVQTTDGLIFVSGYNEHGQLGLGHNEHVPTFKEFPIPAKDIKNFNISNVSTVVQKTDDDFYLCGNNAFNKFGFGDRLGERDTVHTPTKFPIDGKDIKRFYIFNCHTVVQKKNGDVYICGKNSYGQCGLGDPYTIGNRDGTICTPTQIIIPNKKISSLTFGFCDSILKTTDHEFYTSGFIGPHNVVHTFQKLTINGQTINNVKYFAFIPELCVNTKLIETTDNISKERKYFICDMHSNNGEPRELNIIDKQIGKISPYSHAMILETTDKKFFLKESNFIKEIIIPGQKIETVTASADPHYSEITKDFALGIILAETTDEKTNERRFFVCGPNELGQLGLGHNKPVETFVEFKIPGKVIKKITFDRYSKKILIETKDGEFLECGDNTKGQLGFGHEEIVCTPTILEDFSNINLDKELLKLKDILLKEYNNEKACEILEKKLTKKDYSTLHEIAILTEENIKDKMYVAKINTLFNTLFNCNDNSVKCIEEYKEEHPVVMHYLFDKAKALQIEVKDEKQICEKYFREENKAKCKMNRARLLD